MTTDYDAPRRTVIDDDAEDVLPELRERDAELQLGELDVDEAELAESFELPGADLSGEELSVHVAPMQPDEFWCQSCFLVYHRSRLASSPDGTPICRDCAE
jgi:hypothetical protein